MMRMEHGQDQRRRQQRAGAPNRQAHQGRGRACAEDRFGHAAAESRADALFRRFLHQHQHNQEQRHYNVDCCENSNQNTSHLNFLDSLLLHYRSAALTISANPFASKLAPPTSAPSMSSWPSNSFAFAGFTLPPYWMRVLAATDLSNIAASSSRMNACTSCACAGVAVFPVPIAHAGSYAITVSSIASLGKPARPPVIWSRITASVCPASRCANVSPTQTMGRIPLARAALARLLTPSFVSPKYCRRSL